MTAVQDLIRELKQFKNFPGVSQPTIEAAIDFAELRLEMERQQVIESYVQGCNDTYGIDEPNANPNYDRQEAEQYYNQTYKTTP